MEWERAKDALAIVGAISLVGIATAGSYWALDAAGVWKKDNSSSSDGSEASMEIPRRNSHPTRIYIDGCFDMMHFGHSNALRQARKLGDVLVVGLCGDSEIVKNKGSAPVMPFSERLATLKACKWVDEVIEGAPYDLTKEWVDELLSRYSIDYIVHGDDPCVTADGGDAYAYAKSIGRFKMFKRTEGISTTDIVGRMLLMTREHHVRTPVAVPDDVRNKRSGSLASLEETEAGTPLPEPPGGVSFLPTSRRIVQFAEGKAPKPGDRVVYMHGAFDLLNEGQIRAMQAARALGDFLIIGLWTDDDINETSGYGFPILNLYERALTVLACRYADEVVIGAPVRITGQMLDTLNVSVVARGTVLDLNPMNERMLQKIESGYAVARERKILHTFESSSPITVHDIVHRVIDRRPELTIRYKKKAKTEADHMANRAYVEEK